MTISQTIAQQLGRVTLALLGAHMLVSLQDGLQFRIQGSQKVNLIQIILDPCDTYTVKCWLVTAQKKNDLGIPYTEMSWQLISSTRDVYFDMLHDVIEQETGIYAKF